jgi:hypothetical protein
MRFSKKPDGAADELRAAVRERDGIRAEAK